MIQEAADLAPCLQPPACFPLEVTFGRTCRMFADGRTKNKARDQHQAEGVVSISRGGGTASLCDITEGPISVQRS